MVRRVLDETATARHPGSEHPPGPAQVSDPSTHQRGGHEYGGSDGPCSWMNKTHRVALTQSQQTALG